VVVLEIDVRERQAGQLGAAHPGVIEQSQQGVVASLFEGRALRRLQQGAHLILGEDGWRLDRDHRRPDPLHGRALDLLLAHRPLEERPDRPVVDADRRRTGTALGEIDEERLDVLTADACKCPRHALLAEEAVEPLQGGHVGADRQLALVLGPQLSPPRLGGAPLPSPPQRECRSRSRG
jgi:hypothetical protein